MTILLLLTIVCFGVMAYLLWVKFGPFNIERKDVYIAIGITVVFIPISYFGYAALDDMHPGITIRHWYAIMAIPLIPYLLIVAGLTYIVFNAFGIDYPLSRTLLLILLYATPIIYGVLGSIFIKITDSVPNKHWKDWHW